MRVRKRPIGQYFRLPVVVNSIEGLTLDNTSYLSHLARGEVRRSLLGWAPRLSFLMDRLRARSTGMAKTKTRIRSLKERMIQRSSMLH